MTGADGEAPAPLWPLQADQRLTEGMSDGPARAFWIRAEDGIRLRAALWLPDTGRTSLPPSATILLFPGRTEFIEKYALIARAMAGWGLAVLMIDWRGQGASDRLIADAGGPRHNIGHVDDFCDYQRDVRAVQRLAQRLALPRPWHLVGHSMGGLIAMRALAEGLPVATVSLTSPMWGIALGRLPDRLSHRAALILAEAACLVGLSQTALPGGKAGPSDPAGGDGPGDDPGFTGNLLTSDPAEWQRMQALNAALPDLVIARPSFGWTRAALAECLWLARQPAPDLPGLITLSDDEQIVSLPAIRQRAETWPKADLLSLSGARHEPFFERPAIRDQLLAAIKARIFADEKQPG